MKKHIILTASLMLCLCHLEAQQNPKVSASLTEKHAQQFSTAGDIRWDQNERVTYAQFNYQNQFWVAYYDNNEQLVATARKIKDLRDLPILVGESLENFRQRRAAGMKLGTVYELVQEGNTRYLITLDGEHETYTLRVDGMGGRSIIDKAPKHDAYKSSKQDDLIAKRIRR